MTIQLERPSAHADLAALIDRRGLPDAAWRRPSTRARRSSTWTWRPSSAEHWLFVAAEAEIPEAGDYVTVDVGPYSVIIVRDDDEEVRAFHNVCRHRGSRMLEGACGSVGNIVCPYHQLDLRTRRAACCFAEYQPATFDRQPFGLKPVHVRTVAGLVFICLADEPPADFDEVAAASSSPTWRRTSWGRPRSRTRSTSSRRATGSW